MLELRKTRGSASATEAGPSDTSRRSHQGDDTRREAAKAPFAPAEGGPSTFVTISPVAQALYQAEVVAEQAAKTAAASFAFCYNNTINENIVMPVQSVSPKTENPSPASTGERQSRPCRTILLK